MSGAPKRPAQDPAEPSSRCATTTATLHLVIAGVRGVVGVLVVAALYLSFTPGGLLVHNATQPWPPRRAP